MTWLVAVHLVFVISALVTLLVVVDPIGQKLIGNPEHGGKDMVDIF